MSPRRNTNLFRVYTKLCSDDSFDEVFVGRRTLDSCGARVNFGPRLFGDVPRCDGMLEEIRSMFPCCSRTSRMSETKDRSDRSGANEASVGQDYTSDHRRAKNRRGHVDQEVILSMQVGLEGLF